MLAEIDQLYGLPLPMPLLKRTLPLAAALALSLATAPVLADSTSSAASSTSTSLGSSSASIGKSSDSASSSKNAVAQGNYTITEMVALDEKPGMLRLRLQAAAETPAPADGSAHAGTQPDALFLTLPREAAERAQLAMGQTVAAHHRPYGVAFSAVNAEGHASPFFLVLDDLWYRELASRPVGA
jgi:hypothetical protein